MKKSKTKKHKINHHDVDLIQNVNNDEQWASEIRSSMPNLEFEKTSNNSRDSVSFLIFNIRIRIICFYRIILNKIDQI